MEDSKFSCKVCGVISNKLKRCSKCKNAYYCCREHQVKDWKVHKFNCQTIETEKSNCLEEPEARELAVALDSNLKDTNIGCDNKQENKSSQKPRESEFDQHPFKLILFKQPQSKEPYQLSSFIADYLKSDGLCVVDNVLSDTKCSDVYEDVMKLCEVENMQSGKLGGGNTSGIDTEKVVNSSIRNDKIKWIEGDDSEVAKYPHICELIGETMDIVVAGLNTFFDDFALSGRTKAMVACYPGEGSAYKKHIDNPVGDGRLVTCIFYLNKNWESQTHGGFLRIFPESKKGDYVDIEPLFNRMIVFWSDSRNPHEVHPAYANRYAITVWYFEQGEREKARSLQVEQEAAKVKDEVKLLNVKMKKMEKKTVEKKIETESIKAMNLLSESELEAICEVIGQHPDPKTVLTQLGIASSIQDLLIEEFERRTKLS